MGIIIVIISILFLSITPTKSDTSVQSFNPSIFNCAFFCLICDETTLTCKTCPLGSVLTNVGRCQSCSPNCLMCSSINQCTKCQQSSAIFTIPQGTFCEPCSQGCISCESLITVTGSQVRLTSCTECFPSFYPTTSAVTNLLICEPCPQGCAYCNNSLACIQCLIGFTLNQTSGNCNDCSDHCKVCNSDLQCIECEIQYYLSTNINTCEQCMEACFMCTDSSTCQLCVQGYYVPLQQSTCVPCLYPCRICNATICFTCQLGSYMNDSYSKFVNNSTGKAYYVIEYAQCVECEPGCQLCSSQGCTSCFQTFFASNGSCLPCEQGCIDCQDNQTCKFCTNGYYLLNEECIQCPENCGGCTYIQDDSAPYVYCNYCMESYININSTCVSCASIIQGCLSCFTETECANCQPGYTLKLFTCIKNQDGPQPQPTPQPDNNSGIGAAYIVMFCIGGTIVLGAIGFGVWTWWKAKAQRENEKKGDDSYLEVF